MGTWPPPSPTTNNNSNSNSNSKGDVSYIPVRAPPPPPRICPPPNKTWFPWLVPLIFIVDVAAFVYTMYVNNCPSHSHHCLFQPSLGTFSFEPYQDNVFLGPSVATLQKMGALVLNLVVDEGEEWRLISCIWLHAGVVHLLANMISLLFVGIRLEKEFGYWKIGILYVLSGFGGSLASSNHEKYSKEPGASLTTSVGASGALFGLLGAMLSELLMNWTIYANKFAALLSLIVIIALNMAVGYLPKVDISAHIGGFLSGFFLGFVLLIRPQFGWVNRKYIPPGYDLKRVKPKHKCYQYLLWIIAFITLVVGYAVAVDLLFGGNTQIVDSIVQLLF